MPMPIQLIFWQDHLTLVCPQLYVQGPGALNTWSHPELFEATSLTVTDAQTKIRTTFGPQISVGLSFA